LAIREDGETDGSAPSNRRLDLEWHIWQQNAGGDDGSLLQLTP